MSDKPNIFDQIRQRAKREAEVKKSPSLKDLQERFDDGKTLKELNRRFLINTQQPIEIEPSSAA